MTLVHGGIVCENCNHELQSGDLGVKLSVEKLVRVCKFCGYEVEID